MTPGRDPSRANKTAAWRGVEEDAHHAPQGSGVAGKPLLLGFSGPCFSVEEGREG